MPSTNELLRWWQGKVGGRTKNVHRAWLWRDGTDTALFYAVGGSKSVYTALQAAIRDQLTIDTAKGKQPLTEPHRRVLMEGK